MSDDRSHVERLADEFAEREAAQHESTDTYAEGQRDAWDQAEHDLRIAIEADRADGQAYTDLAAEAARRAVLAETEVERLQKDNARLERISDLEAKLAEAKLARVRALADEWEQFATHDADPWQRAMWQQAVNGLRAVLDKQGSGDA